MKQKGFADLSYEYKKKRTRREIFLSEMEEILPWRELMKPIRRYYPNSKYGRPPIALEVMLRIHFMQQWYALSDPAIEDSLYDIESMRRFAGVDLDAVPDETTICKFRHFLERHDLPAKLLRVSEQHLSQKGLLVNEGTIVDATIISAPPSTKNKSRSRDPEMKQTKKGNQWFFGMKAHIGTDPAGLVHSVVVTDASVHDSTVMDDLLHGEECVVYGDKAYANASRKAEFEEAGGTWRVNRKARRGCKLNAADKAFNRKSNRTRARGEHPFGVVKNLWGHRKVRYKGLDKNANQMFTLFALSNFFLTRKQLAMA